MTAPADRGDNVLWTCGITSRLLEGLSVIVTRAVDRGELPAHTDVELLAMLPIAVLQQWRLVSDQRPDEQLMGRIVEQFYTARKRHS